MKAVDTNVLARLILQDDEAQAHTARGIVRQPVWVSNTVWLELGWVLGKRLGLDRQIVADALMAVLSIDTVHTADRKGIMWAIERYRSGADWADVMHLVAANGAADCFVTFDRAIDRQMDESAPLPVETLA